MTHFFYSLVKFCVGLIFIITGLLAVVIPWSPPVRTSFVDWILQSSMEIWVFGALFVMIGCYLVVYSLWQSRSRYYRIQIDNPSILITESIVQDYLSSYWKSLFPLNEVPYRLEMKRRKIGVFADLPFIPLDDRKDLILQVERDLSEIFREHLGYNNRLDVRVSFQKAK